MRVRSHGHLTAHFGWLVYDSCTRVCVRARRVHIRMLLRYLRHQPAHTSARMYLQCTRADKNDSTPRMRMHSNTFCPTTFAYQIQVI
jgi:hypothetical protein